MANIDLRDFKTEIETHFNINIDFKMSDEVFYFESNKFELSFQIEDKTFVIRNIEVFEKSIGLGQFLIEFIVDYFRDLDSNEIKANQVKSSAISFWEKCGFEFDGEDAYLSL